MNQSSQKLITADCLSKMKEMESGSFDLVITSPPYNLLRTSGGGIPHFSKLWKNPRLKNGYEDHTDDMPHAEYVAWQRECLAEMLRLVHESGAVFYNHKWRVQDGLLQDRQDIVSGFPVRQIIIWQRTGGVNFNRSFFLSTYEVIYLIAKPKFKLRQEAVKYGDVWNIRQESKNEHPAAFPIEIPKRILLSVQDVKNVLDPFSGSGTTMLACKQCDINGIGIEKSQKYNDMASERLGLSFPKAGLF